MQKYEKYFIERIPNYFIRSFQANISLQANKFIDLKMNVAKRFDVMFCVDHLPQVIEQTLETTCIL